MSKRRRAAHAVEQSQQGPRGAGQDRPQRAPRRARQDQPRQRLRDIFVPRPFQGMVDEPEWVALRELVPAATAPLRLAPDLVQEHGDRAITLATVLPMAWPALTKPDGRIFLGMQRHVQSGDVSRDLAEALLCALRSTPGEQVVVPALPGPGRRLQDVLVDGPLDITMHDGFQFWLDDDAGDDPGVQSSLERANASIYPTVRLAAARAAYWCRVPEKAHVRWVLTEEEDTALDALAKLAAAASLGLGEGTRFAGMFRAHGLLVPVWDLPREPEAARWEAPVAEFAKRFAEALADPQPMGAAQRRARQGLLGRQITIR
jgi:hypothetical protein